MYEVPGERPTSLPAVPEIVVAFVLVTVEAPRTTYVDVVPWRTTGLAAEVRVGIRSAPATTATVPIELSIARWDFLDNLILIFSE